MSINIFYIYQHIYIYTNTYTWSPYLLSHGATDVIAAPGGPKMGQGLPRSTGCLRPGGGRSPCAGGEKNKGEDIGTIMYIYIYILCINIYIYTVYIYIYCMYIYIYTYICAYYIYICICICITMYTSGSQTQQ